jgi:flavin-dependent thymidylate synthase
MNNSELTVELLGYYGGDLTHALSAWTSTSRELTPEKIKRIPALLKQLVAGSDGNSHKTPFEKSSLHFMVRTDIATHIQILKHRVGTSLNAESARYKELKEDNYYIPDDFPPEWKEILAKHTEEGLRLYHACLDDLIKNHGFTKARAKESARYFRGYNTIIAADIMFNFSSFIHFLGLRHKRSAQDEIKRISGEMLKLVIGIDDFKYSLQAFGLIPPTG